MDADSGGTSMVFTIETNKLIAGKIRVEGDARLIAAAPALLAEAIELLRNATYADGQGFVLTQDCEALEAAIARATGAA
jgi:hypothetical protein